MRIILLITILSISFSVLGQNYTSWLSGNPSDTAVKPSGGICLMGGATENDEAVKWFLKQAAGGDVLVLRTSGTDGYNSYMYNLPGIDVNSVETILFNSASAAYEPYVLQQIQNAEAIWLAGGDQWDYVNYWRNSPVDSIINTAINNRNMAVGGTSAGMAILGRFYFSAENGTVTSQQAITNPYNNKVTVDSAAFMQVPFLNNTITDTHYDNPSRKGRHMVFLARILTDFGYKAKGIACDEYTAVCIDTNGIAHVYGHYPDYDDNAWFIQTNCELPDIHPEVCSPGNPLQWNLGGKALKACQLKGNINGTNSFNLNDWETTTGGSWFNWYVDSSGDFHETPGTQIDCPPTSVQNIEPECHISLYPNPAADYITISIRGKTESSYTLMIRNSHGLLIKSKEVFSDEVILDIRNLNPGIYFLLVHHRNNASIIKKIIKS